MFGINITETNTLISEISSVLPVLKYSSIEEKEVLIQIKDQIPSSVQLKENQVLLRLQFNSIPETDKLIVDVLIYDKQKEEDINNEWPRQIGKAYIYYGQIRAVKVNGAWKITEFIDHF